MNAEGDALLDWADSDTELSLIGEEEFIDLGCSLFLSVDCDGVETREPCSEGSGGRGVESLDATESGVAVMLGEAVVEVGEREGQSGECVEMSAM